MRVDIHVGLQLLFEPVSYAAVEEDGTSSLVIEVFDDSDKGVVAVVLLHGCPQSCIPNPVLGLLKVYEAIIDDLATEILETGIHGVQLLPGLTELFTLLFADDLALLSCSLIGLQTQLDCLQKVCLD